MKVEYVIKRAILKNSGLEFADSKSEQMILREMGEKGFRYAGYHPSEVIGFGRVKSINLIFERCREDR